MAEKDQGFESDLGGGTEGAVTTYRLETRRPNFSSTANLSIVKQITTSHRQLQLIDPIMLKLSFYAKKFRCRCVIIVD